MDGTDCSADFVPPAINSGDNAWILASSALVLLMTPGLGMFYGGLVGAKNVLNTVLMSYACGCVVVVQWIIVGYSFAFGSGNGAFGSFDKAGLHTVNNKPNIALAPNLPEMTFVVFQMTFAMITPALMSGSIACRLKFRTWLVFLLVWTTIVYDLVAHWVWGAWVTGYVMQDGVCTPQIAYGWLRAMGAIDFAGGAVVHITSGVSALTACILIGPRRDDTEENKPHNVPLMMIGAALLWFGWFGFNGGSAINSSDGIAALAIMNSNISAGVAFSTWIILDAVFMKRISVVGAFTGSIVGLATITPACGFVRPLSSLAIGFIGAVCAYFGIKLKERLKYDDTLDVFACHGIGGILGVFMLGLFAETEMNPGGPNGAFFGNPMLLAIQLLVIAVTAGTSIVLTLGILIPLKFLPGFGLTLDVEKEKLGMDYAAHREVSYRMDSHTDLSGPWGMPTTAPPSHKPNGLRVPPKPTDSVIGGNGVEPSVEMQNFETQNGDSQKAVPAEDKSSE